MNGFIETKEYVFAPTAFPAPSQSTISFNSSAPAIYTINDREMAAYTGKLFYFRAVLLQIFILSLLIGFSHFARADTDYLSADYQMHKSQGLQLASIDNQAIDEEKRRFVFSDTKKVRSSWALAFDNDLLAPGHRDRDYTYGVNLTYSGASAENAFVSLKTPLDAIDQWLGADHLVKDSLNNYSVEVGLYGFTPEELERVTVDETDRPYASLVYMSSSREQIDIDQNIAWNTTLTVGVLGLGFVGDLQNSAHQETDSKSARGWNHQISDGGELTGRYVIARQRYFENFSDTVELKSTVQASIGYLTEASWGMSFRAGKIISPWASFNPDLISYGEKSTYSSNTASTNEHYFWSGFTLKARFYNAFLQGQFRHSDFSYSYSDLRPLIAEAWVGYTYAFKQGYRISYVLRAQSSELKQGDGDRNVVWGGLIFAKTI